MRHTPALAVLCAVFDLTCPVLFDHDQITCFFAGLPCRRALTSGRHPDTSRFLPGGFACVLFKGEDTSTQALYKKGSQLTSENRKIKIWVCFFRPPWSLWWRLLPNVCFICARFRFWCSSGSLSAYLLLLLFAQLMIKGGPHSDYTVEYSVEEGDTEEQVVNVGPSGIVEALNLGDVKVTAKIVMHDGATFTCKVSADFSSTEARKVSCAHACCSWPGQAMTDRRLRKLFLPTLLPTIVWGRCGLIQFDPVSVKCLRHHLSVTESRSSHDMKNLV